MATVTVTVSNVVLSSLLSPSASSEQTSAAPTTTARAEPQAGVLEGASPVAYQASNPIILFIIQAAIIIVLSRLLRYPLALLQQPQVISEVIAGIILGPSVLFRIPGFQEAIFPKESIPVLNNVANIGLVLFLFLVGLEVDVRRFVSNWRTATSVGLLGMAVPFGFGWAISWGLFNEYHEDDPSIVPISFGVYGLFIGTALSITAFPVLCRILTELKLLSTHVGVTVLAAGVGNDVVGWIMLALCVALVNSGSGLAALWALLCTIGWALFLALAVRPAMFWIIRRSGTLQAGPSQGIVALTLLLMLISAWFTAIIGIHAIFGAFLVGLICPRHGGFVINLVEKIEDLVSVLFLPLYFALSGLSTNLGLLNDGTTWGYVVGIIAVALISKIVGGAIAACIHGLLWRESFTIGVLMSCKGLVELIVLNIGLQARILTQTTFTMFVLMALITTFITTPLTNLLYPPAYQTKVERWRRGEIDWQGNLLVAGGPRLSQDSLEKLTSGQIRRVVVFLRLDCLPSLFTFIALLGEAVAATPSERRASASQPPDIPQEEGADRPSALSDGAYTPAERSDTASQQQAGPVPPSSRHMTSQREEAPAAVPHYPLEVHALRLLELTQRTSSVMAVTEASSHGFDSEFRVVATRDPVLDAFRAFAALHDVAASGQVAVVPTHGYAEALALRAAKWHFMDAAPAGESADLVLVPWTESGGLGSDGGMLGGIGGSGIPTLVPSTSVSRSRGGSGGGDGDHPLSQQPRFAGRQHLAFVQAVLRRVGDICTVGILISDSLGGLATRSDPEVHTGGGKAPAAEGEKPAGLTRTRSSASGRLTASRRQRTSQQQPIQQQFFPPILDRSQVVLVPFVGGADDRVALRLGLQLARSQRVVLHVVRLKFDRDGGAEADESESESGDDDDEGAHDVQNEKSADADDKAGASKATDTAAATLSTESPVPKDKDQKIMKKENEGEEEENGGEEEEGKNKEEENEEREKKEKKGEDEEGKKKKKEGDEEKKKKPIYRRIAALRYTGRGGRRRRRRLSVSSKSGTHLDDAPSTMDLALLSSVRRSLPPGLGDRVHFHEVFVAMPPTPNGGRTGSGASGTAVGALADAAVAAARVYVRRKAGNAGDIIVVGRRRDGGAGAGKPGDDCRRGPGPSASASASAAAVDGTGEAGESSASAGGSDSAAASSAKGDAGGHSIRNDFQATVGVLAERLVAARLGASVLVVQAARRAFMNA